MGRAAGDARVAAVSTDAARTAALGADRPATDRERCGERSGMASGGLAGRDDGLVQVSRQLRMEDCDVGLQPKRAVITNMHSDLDYEVLRQSLPPKVAPAYDGMQLRLEHLA